MIAWLEHMTRTPSQSALDRARWDYAQLICALVLAFLLQSLFLPCLCYIGTARMQFALIIDTLVLARIIVAGVMHERDRTWIFYIVLLYSSPIWICFLFRHG